MSFRDATYKLKPVYGYPQAHRHFEGTRKPRTHRWDETQRPLYNTASHHYRLERSATLCADGMPEYYQAVHYDTPLARFYRPNEDGSYEVWVRYWNSTTSKNFLQRVTGFYPGRIMRDEIGLDVHIPLSPHSVAYSAPTGVFVPNEWSAVLTFNADRKLIRSRSAHKPVFRRVTSTDRKSERARLTALFKPYVDVLMLSLPSIHSDPDMKVAIDDGRPFKSAHLSSIKMSAVQAFHHFVVSGATEMSEQAFDGMRRILFAVYRFSYAKWAYDYQGPDATCSLPGDSVWKAFRSWQPIPIPNNLPVLPEARVRPAFMKVLLDYCHTGHGDDREDLGQFPEHLPRTYYYQ